MQVLRTSLVLAHCWLLSGEWLRAGQGDYFWTHSVASVGQRKNRSSELGGHLPQPWLHSEGQPRGPQKVPGALRSSTCSSSGCLPGKLFGLCLQKYL